MSKYKRGQTVPTGSTQFQFHAAALNFHSTENDWLVVSGARAQYKGIGTVNGVAGYAFLLTAVDSGQPGGGTADRLRMRIWRIADGITIYDNQIDADDLADPTTVLGGGSIVIHKGR